LRSSERAKIALVKKVGVKLAFLVVYNGSEIEPFCPLWVLKNYTIRKAISAPSVLKQLLIGAKIALF
jgi:hypothetical protein